MKKVSIGEACRYATYRATQAQLNHRDRERAHCKHKHAFMDGRDYEELRNQDGLMGIL